MKEAIGNQRQEIGSSGHRIIGPSEDQHQNQKQQPNRFTTEDTHSTPSGRSGQAPGTERGDTAAGRRAEALLRKIGEACDELDRLAEENPELIGCVTRGAEEHKDAYLRLKARLALADQAPRCRWVRQDGTGCGSPQMKKHIYCFAHKQMMEAQALALSLPALEDANAIQIGIMRIQKAMIEGTISTKMAGLLLYSMQLAMTNVGRTTFGQVKAGELVRETVSLEEAISDQRSADSENQDSPRRRGDAEETKTLPLMNADDADQQELEEFVALPGGAGYRFTRLKIDPKTSGDRVSPAKAERDGSWGEFPKSAFERDTLSGSFDAPSLASPLRLAQDDKGKDGIA